MRDIKLARTMDRRRRESHSRDTRLRSIAGDTHDHDRVRWI